MKKFNGTLGKISNGTHIILVPTSVADHFLKKSKKRVLCAVNNSEFFHAALNRSIEFGYYIYVNKRIINKTEISIGGAAKVVLKEDETALQFSFPEELEHVLQLDLKAHKQFEALTAGGKRSIAAYVMQVKSSDKRIERALRVASKLALGVTSLKLMIGK